MVKKLDYAALFTLRKDGRYMGYYRGPDGKRRAIYDRDPERLYHKIEEKENPEAARATFRQVAETWEGEYRDRVTVRTWNNFRPHYEALVAKWGDRPVEEITAAEISADLQAAKAKGYSHTIVNSRKVIITGIMDRALADDLIPYNPAISVRLPKGLKKGKRSAPSDDIIKTICGNIDKPFGFFPFLLLCTGLRKSEALALLKSDINLDKREISVTKSLTYISNSNPVVKPPKTASSVRTVPIIQMLVEPLRAACEAHTAPELFPAAPSNRSRKAGGYMSEHAYEGAWERYCAAAGLIGEDGQPVVTAHNLRHGTATLLYEAGVDVYTAQRILGHSNVRTTLEIYTDLRNKQAQKSIKKFDKALSKMLSKKK